MRHRNPLRFFVKNIYLSFEKDENSEEVVTMRAAMDEFHKNLHSIEKLPANFTLLPPDDFSNSQSSSNVNSISKVSQVTTRRAEKKQLKKRNKLIN